MNRRGIGWRREYERRRVGDFTPDPIVPSGWDVLLGKLQMTDADVVPILSMGSAPWGRKAGEALRAYARSNRFKLFVPEAVLDVMGLKEDVERHCGGPDERVSKVYL